MAAGGVILPGWNPPKTKINPTTLFGNPASFTAAADQQASDYDKIMKNYQDLIGNYSRNPITSQNITPERLTPKTTEYKQSDDVTKSLANLGELSRTGGYSNEDKANLRARGVSPIRSIYANAQQNMNRQKSIQGGYSPNFNAASSKMARDLSESLASATTNVEAGIAQNVASNRLSAAPNYAAASGSANAAQTAANQKNTDIINQINQANANSNLQAQTTNANNNLQSQFGNRGNILSAIQGQTSLYGTTPALTSTFGNQVIQAGQLGQDQQRLDEQKKQSSYNFMSRFGGSGGGYRPEFRLG